MLGTFAVVDDGYLAKQTDLNRSVDMGSFPHDLIDLGAGRTRSDRLDYPDERAWEDDLYTAKTRSASTKSLLVADAKSTHLWSNSAWLSKLVLLIPPDCPSL